MDELRRRRVANDIASQSARPTPTVDELRPNALAAAGLIAVVTIGAMIVHLILFGI